jgi:hypothetical protein
MRWCWFCAQAAYLWKVLLFCEYFTSRIRMNSMWRNLLIHRTAQYSRPIPYSARLRTYEIFQSFDFTYDIPHSNKPTLFFSKLYVWLLACLLGTTTMLKYCSTSWLQFWWSHYYKYCSYCRGNHVLVFCICQYCIKWNTRIFLGSH